MLKKKCSGHIVVFILEFIFILILLPGCFRREELAAEFWGEDIREQTVPEDGYERFCSEKIKLAPGVYQTMGFIFLRKVSTMILKYMCWIQ